MKKYFTDLVVRPIVLVADHLITFATLAVTALTSFVHQQTALVADHLIAFANLVVTALTNFAHQLDLLLIFVLTLLKSSLRN